MKIVIAGLGAAGFSALMAVKKAAPSAGITVIDPKEKEIFHPCGLPFVLKNGYDPAVLFEPMNLSLMGICRIKSVLSEMNPEKQEILTASGEKVTYDRLIICTGAEPFLPDIPGINEISGRGLFTFASAEDLVKIRDHISGRVLISGAGPVGLEAACSLSGNITVLEAGNRVLPGLLDPDMSLLVEKHITASGKIQIIKNFPVTEAAGKECFEGFMSGSTFIQGDTGIMAAGFRPVRLPAGFRPESLPWGILTDSSMETSVKNIFAAGDAVCPVSVTDGKPYPVKLASSAVIQGRTAGICAAGGKASYRGSAGSFAAVLNGLEVAACGFNAETAAERGFDPVSGKFSGIELYPFMADDSSVTVKITADRATGLILGCQATGRSAGWRVSLAAGALFSGTDIDRFMETELCYCPELGQAEDPLMKAADFCRRRILKS